MEPNGKTYQMECTMVVCRDDCRVEKSSKKCQAEGQKHISGPRNAVYVSQTAYQGEGMRSAQNTLQSTAELPEIIGLGFTGFSQTLTAAVQNTR